MAFTYPFRYTPDPRVSEAARLKIAEIAATPKLNALFTEGKMLGVLVCRETVLYGFSGLVTMASQDGTEAELTAQVEGFVPPIFDYSRPDGYFRRREAEIVAAPREEQGAMSRELQGWLFGQYRVMNGQGEEMSIADIFALRGIVPPGGTGECAAPKLLNHAFRNGLTPLAMGEFWYGRSNSRQIREQGRFYPSCTGKCGPLLTWMMQGLDIEPNPLDKPYVTTEPRVLHADSDIIVVDKPSGMLSVHGKTAAPCLIDWLSERYGEVHSCHRLDQDTSGVMVYARNVSVKSAIEAQFAQRQVGKTYRARLVASPQPFEHARKGTICLPMMPDYYERPRQMVDPDEGKRAVTKYEILDEFPDGEIEVRFCPQTGRTHQLRVHAAHPQGLGRPIKGDCLYGAPDGGPLFLKAESLEFTHPATGRRVTFRV